LDERMRRLISCPWCKSGFRMLVEGKKEGFFSCLQCGRDFVLPSMFEETQSRNSILDKVMP